MADKGLMADFCSFHFHLWTKQLFLMHKSMYSGITSTWRLLSGNPDEYIMLCQQAGCPSADTSLLQSVCVCHAHALGTMNKQLDQAVDLHG